ncbi:diguanylate cyclase/phosphodiesterase (GGDEF & EAL domains) with PAS/PAC sensor(s) [Acidisarcina polymorpha]|uniref:Diguanylate cyclase/phosphodiesterase (GGDEF & EAL domains) with PAS/PAC sensor(S) n=1 Tax=Acidisarcina polymorpha TaxID=2211140 RepID=A0A2Z5G0Y4_9BACT|nr:GGDEF and EAL domain-containing protein [Acidisarcina polymorpha]AXC12823.1 diguanylate cyclase/phosphodiesterase (GGDEF & EAL domains) with PAS/PAC sensor(s) [Acidisarcina polymorpha]
MIAIQLLAGVSNHWVRAKITGSAPRDAAWIGTFTLVVIGLVALKSIANRRYQTDRDLLEAFLEHIPDNVFFKDRNSRFIRISRAMADYCGLAHPSQAVNKTDSDIFSSEHAARALADEQEIILTGEPVIGVEEKETWPDGHESWVLTTKVPLKDRRGQIIGTMGIAHNITDRKLAEAKIHHMALHDALTGLPNRILLEDRLTQATVQAARDQTRLSVLMLDLDRFKNVNDSFGHRVGDRLLEAVSKRLRACLRDSDIVARLGGDEFIIAAPMSSDDKGGERVAQKILAALIEPFQIEGRDLRISGSVGICAYPTDGENPQALLRSADAAMYEAKKLGRGAYRSFASDLTDTARTRRNLENDLLQACARGEFVLYYQPLVSTVRGVITGVEALLRWDHPIYGLTPPGQFIPQLEEMGLMVEVGKWVLRTACMQNVMWQKERLSPVRVAVNVSAQQFYGGDIVDAVDQVLRETELDAKYLELELTETLTLDASENTVAIMQDLKSLGVSLSLDDFGTGWSSLSYLSRFPLDRLKIDRSFMRDIASRPAARAVVGGIINLGRSLHLDCIGEGVETRQQLDYLREQQCSEVQGFLYSPPLPVADCSTLLRFGLPGFIDEPNAYLEEPAGSNQ